MNQLDNLWAEVNALGGDFDPYDEFARGCHETIEVVLQIIEKMGGMDPLQRQAELEH